MNRLQELTRFAQLTAAHAWNIYGYKFPELSTPCPEVTISKRLKTTAGHCKVEKHEIVLCYDLLDLYPDEFKRDIIPHELAHQVAYDVFGVGKQTTGKIDWHGRDWQRVMILAGYEPSRTHSLINTRYKR